MAFSESIPLTKDIKESSVEVEKLPSKRFQAFIGSFFLEFFSMM